jgi:hypothetical protein
MEINQVFPMAEFGLEFYRVSVDRYRYGDILRRIRRAMEAVGDDGMPPKVMQDKIGMTKDQWSRKMTVNPEGTGGKRTSFNLEEYSRIADALGAPNGWPFIEWEVAKANADAFEALRSLGDKAHVIPPKASPPAQQGKPRKGARRS